MKAKQRTNQDALKAYVKSLTPDDRVDYALKAGTSSAYLNQIIYGHSIPSAELARNLAEESGWAVHPSDILPVFAGIPPLKRKAQA